MSNQPKFKHPLCRFLEDCLQDEGSLWLEEKKFFNLVKEKKQDISSYDILCDKKDIKKLSFDGINYISFDSIHNLETKAAYDVMRILYSDTLEPVSPKVIDEKIDEVQKVTGITLHSEQRAAVHTMVNNSFCVITGGPGTGKTCTLNTAVKVLEMLYPGICIKFTAPTGKAARRVTQSVQRPSKTIQKELRLTFTKKTPDEFEGDVLVIDEVSMLDMETAASVFQSVRNGQRLILIGDTEQLPSVGIGAVLRDLIDSKCIPVTMLIKTFRQAMESALFANILLCKKGEPNLVSDNEEFVIQDALGGEKTLNQIADVFCEEVEKAGLDNVVCLIPYRKAGNICANKLNNILQARINPDDSMGIKSMPATLDNGQKVTYRIGDPVLQLVNRNECANGDVGKVVDIDGDKLYVDYQEPTGEMVRVMYWKSQLPKELSLAYAMSINKSQGSEYKTVVMCMTTEHKAMLSRNMLYTGITRAKKRVIYIHEKKATEIAMKNIAMYKNEISDGRTTLFGEKLRHYKSIFEIAARYAA